MGPLPEWVVGMSPGMSSCVSPPRICSAPRKILRLNPSRGSRLLQTPETFLKENHPKVPTVLPSPALPIQPVFTAAPLFVSMLWACHPYCLPGGGSHKPPFLRRAPPLLQPEGPFPLLSLPEGLLALPGRSGRLLPWGGPSVHRGWLFPQSLEKFPETQLGTVCGPVPEEAFRLGDQILYPKT